MHWPIVLLTIATLNLMHMASQASQVHRSLPHKALEKAIDFFYHLHAFKLIA